HLRAVESFRVIRRGLEPDRALEIAQIDRVPSLTREALDDLGLTRPHADGGAGAREVNRQRRSPAATADDRCSHARRSPRRRSFPASSRPMFSWWRTMTTATPAAQATTRAPGYPSMTAPSGTHRAARIEASDTYRKLSVIASHTSAAGATAHGTR